MLSIVTSCFSLLFILAIIILTSLSFSIVAKLRENFSIALTISYSPTSFDKLAAIILPLFLFRFLIIDGAKVTCGVTSGFRYLISQVKDGSIERIK